MIHTFIHSFGSERQGATTLGIKYLGLLIRFYNFIFFGWKFKNPKHKKIKINVLMTMRWCLKHVFLLTASRGGGCRSPALYKSWGKWPSVTSWWLYGFNRYFQAFLNTARCLFRKLWSRAGVRTGLPRDVPERHNAEVKVSKTELIYYSVFPYAAYSLVFNGWYMYNKNNKSHNKLLHSLQPLTTVDIPATLRHRPL